MRAPQGWLCGFCFFVATENAFEIQHHRTGIFTAATHGK
jgi:hypothetical protein